MSELDGLYIDGLDAVEVVNTSINDIDSENVNLILVGIDESGSMYPYVGDMGKSLKDFQGSIIDSKEVDEILVARADFANGINVGGYKKITDFQTNYKASGGTALYDVIIEGKEKLVTYMEFLKNQGMRVKAVFAIFSDGEDTSSKNSVTIAKRAIDELNSLEITTAFISFGGGADAEAKTLGFKNILPVGGSASELRKAFNCLSKSVIESSKTVVNDPNNFFTI